MRIVRENRNKNLLRGIRFFSNYEQAFEQSHLWKTNYHRDLLIIYSIVYEKKYMQYQDSHCKKLVPTHEEVTTSTETL